MATIIHRETIALRATPEQVRAFIMDPQRILDYYPDGIEGEVIEPGQSFYCRGKAGVSLLERLPQESRDNKLVVLVTTATGLKPPFTAERIRAARFFSMVEDWELEATDSGCLLTKTWRNLNKYRLRFLPLGMIVKRSAKAESPHLQAAWNKAAATPR